MKVEREIIFGWMYQIKEIKNISFLLFFKNHRNIESKENLNFTAKTMITKTKEFISSTKIFTKIYHKIHSLGGKINLHYWD